MTALLADLSNAAPLLVAVDDGQWLDPSSANALAFALHRLDDRDVRLLMAIRIDRLPEARPNIVQVRAVVGTHTCRIKGASVTRHVGVRMV